MPYPLRLEYPALTKAQLAIIDDRYGHDPVVRRLLKEVGFPVQQLARIEFGPIKLGQLKPGGMRALTVQEIGELYQVVGL